MFLLSLHNFCFPAFCFLDTLLSKLRGDLKKTRRAAYADGTHKNHKTQWKAYLYFCFLFARISNLAPASVSSFDPSKQLCRGDIVVTRFGLSVSFKWSKTNQTGAKLLNLPLLYALDPHLCPVRAYLHMCSCLPATAQAPAFFTGYRTGSYIVITKPQFVLNFRRRLARMGVPNPSSFRGHSFCRGGATWAFHTDVPGELIQIYGDWVSDAYKCYLEFSEDAKLRVAQEMVSSPPGVLNS